MGGSKGSNGNSNSQVGNQNAGGGAKSSNVGGASGGGGGNASGNMKAPGRDYTITRESFESNPAAYFKDLRK